MLFPAGVVEKGNVEQLRQMCHWNERLGWHEHGLNFREYAFKTSDISEASGPRILGKRVSINRFAFSSEWQRYTVMIHDTMGMVTSDVHFLLSGMAFYFGQPRAE